MLIKYADGKVSIKWASLSTATWGVLACSSMENGRIYIQGGPKKVTPLKERCGSAIYCCFELKICKEICKISKEIPKEICKISYK